MQAQLAAIPATDLEVWSKPLNGKQSNERAVVLFNRNSTVASMTVSWNDINLDGPTIVGNLLEHTDLGTMDAGYTTMVPAHEVTVLKVIGNAR
ncbi:MAG: hypothetical protein PHH37_14260 [Paludibacter sp.]|nr:hypothetical protein [Paludibacter sp.]